jgi:hypothetical protein
MFTALRREFLPDLEVSDEGGYYETRDLAELRRRFSFLREAINALTEGLQRHGLSREAAEDPDILLHRIERIAAQVHRTLRRPAEHPPVTFPDAEASGGVLDPEAAEALWDDLFKHNRRQQERLQRALEERRSLGEEDEEAFEHALNDLGLEAPNEESGEADELWQEQEPFAESLEGTVSHEANAWDDEEARPLAFTEEERQPLLKRTMELLKLLHDVFRDAAPQLRSSLDALFQGAGDAMGGLAQALSERGEEDDPDEYGLRVTQLKRALRGAAFARGALFPLRSAVSTEQLDDLHRTLEQLEEGIFHELGQLRSDHRAEDAE